MANDKSSRGVDKWGEGDEGEDWKKHFEVKKELEEEEEEEDIIPPKSDERDCEVCGRRFKSGKALGGHMRIHFLKKDDKKQNKKKKKNNQTTIKLEELKEEPQENEKDPEETVQIPTCPLCPKTFRSLKSMYGHLRSHPNRYWRGSRPPSNGNVVINHDSSIRSSSLMLMLSRWPVTASRGGSGNKSISDYSRNLIEEDEELLQGCTNLWYLSRGGTSKAHIPSSILILQRGSSSQAAAAEVAAEADHVLLPISKSSSTTTSEDDDNLTRKLIKHMKVNFKSDSTNSCDDERLITLKINCNKKRKLVMDSDPCQKYMKKSSNVIRGCIPPSKNQCNICNKRFMSYHGLGGHMSIHSTRERNINNIPQHRDRSKQVADIGGIGIQLYRCRWCLKNFSTAQALEGHKCHKSTNSGSLTISEPREDNRVINLRFDLNEMPYLQEDVNERQPSSSDNDNTPSASYDDDNTPSA